MVIRTTQAKWLSTFCAVAPKGARHLLILAVHLVFAEMAFGHASGEQYLTLEIKDSPTIQAYWEIPETEIGHLMDDPVYLDNLILSSLRIGTNNRPCPLEILSKTEQMIGLIPSIKVHMMASCEGPPQKSISMDWSYGRSEEHSYDLVLYIKNNDKIDKKLMTNNTGLITFELDSQISGWRYGIIAMSLVLILSLVVYLVRTNSKD
tara:strand:- start:2712 stop:3329 length:618 start_codon:yes stop_codon:yes gene_type:complete